MLTEMNKYVKFFRILMKEIMDKAARQNIFILELRHTAGRLFDEDCKSITLLKEL